MNSALYPTSNMNKILHFTFQKINIFSLDRTKIMLEEHFSGPCHSYSAIAPSFNESKTKIKHIEEVA